jgi:DNA-binding NarL/FixJ family response regulator
MVTVVPAGESDRERARTARRAARVLLVEDHASYREALAHVVGREPDLCVVAQAGSLAAAREALLAAGPSGVDVALVDLGLPDGDGAGAIRELREASPRCRVLVLSASVDPVRQARAVEAGASCVLHKAAGLKEIVEAVKALGEGRDPLRTETGELLRTTSAARESHRAARRAVESLTEREREVLRALAEGLDNAEIAARLDMTIHTERTHMVHIFNKLGAHSRLQALVSAVRTGAVRIS